MIAVRPTIVSLQAFEERVKDAFLNGDIRAPVHLSGGNEDKLIDIFQRIRDEDWVFSTWRNHYHALLKGIPEDWLYDEILAGRSMMIHSKEHRFLTSSIVGGILPIALGVAMGIQRNGGTERVWVFVGDMAAQTGVFHEFRYYARGHDLPIHIVIEDNGLSTNTPTKESWGTRSGLAPVDYYAYRRTFPHVGVGTFVTFA